eukprot:5223356-Lingulodinium_polyedra.AAC.1
MARAWGRTVARTPAHPYRRRPPPPLQLRREATWPCAEWAARLSRRSWPGPRMSIGSRSVPRAKWRA